MGFGWAAMIAAGLAPVTLLYVIELFTILEARRKRNSLNSPPVNTL
ncbi:MAG TPA: hypothetical protein VK608_00295 [Edaphobacter sp.]|nr:hypothetical protein [Edaphobacter sp.]